MCLFVFICNKWWYFWSSQAKCLSKLHLATPPPNPHPPRWKKKNAGGFQLFFFQNRPFLRKHSNERSKGTIDSFFNLKTLKDQDNCWFTWNDDIQKYIGCLKEQQKLKQAEPCLHKLQFWQVILSFPFFFESFECFTPKIRESPKPLHPGKLTFWTQQWRFGSDNFPFQCKVIFSFQLLIFRGVT